MYNHNDVGDPYIFRYGLISLLFTTISKVHRCIDRCSVAHLSGWVVPLYEFQLYRKGKQDRSNTYFLNIDLLLYCFSIHSCSSSAAKILYWYLDLVKLFVLERNCSTSCINSCIAFLMTQAVFAQLSMTCIPMSWSGQMRPGYLKYWWWYRKM